MVEYLGLGDEIDYKTLNGLVYLLRKFKRLTNDLRLGNSVITTDYGTLAFTGGLVSLGGNFIIESPVTVSANDCLRNCFYSLHFTVIDRNLSGTVNRRVATVTGNTGETGELEITIPTTLLESDEVILPDFKLDIVLDPHEYYTPISQLNIELDFARYVSAGETVPITAIVTDNTGTPIPDLEFQVYIGHTHQTATTDQNGEIKVYYTGQGSKEWLDIWVGNEHSSIYDGEVLTAEFYGDTITIGKMYTYWLTSNDYVVIDWGDGTSTLVNYYEELIGNLTHDYDVSDYYSIRFIGDITQFLSAFKDCTGLTSVTFTDTVTRLGESCFKGCTGLTSVTLPDSLTSLEYECFKGCTSLTSVTIPNSVVSLGTACFDDCTGLTSITIPSNIISLGDYCFDGCSNLESVIILEGVTSIGYGCFKGCGELLSVTIPSSVTSLGEDCFYGCIRIKDYQLYWETSIIAYDSDTMPYGYSTVFTIPYGLTNAYTTAGYPSNKLTERSPEPDTITITSDKQIIQSSETATITTTLTDNGQGVPDETLTYEIKHGDTTITTGSDTTDSNGEIEINYTGTGTGEISIIVSYGTLLQETYGIGDYLFWDNGVDGNNNWLNTGVTVSRDSTGALLGNTSSTNYFYRANKIGTSSDQYDWEAPFVVEYDVVSITNAGNVLSYIYDGVNENLIKTMASNTLGVSDGSHVRITYDGETCHMFVDDVEKYNISLESTRKFQIGWRINNATLKYKNFKIYSA